MKYEKVDTTRYVVMKVIPSIVGSWETPEVFMMPHEQASMGSDGALKGAKSICSHRAAGNPGVEYRVREVEGDMPEDVGDLPMLYSATLKFVDNSGG